MLRMGFFVKEFVQFFVGSCTRAERLRVRLVQTVEIRPASHHKVVITGNLLKFFFFAVF